MKHLPIIERAITHGDRLAVRSASQCHAYTDLVARSERTAASLLDRDDDLSERRVAHLIPAGSDYIATQWGIWRAGGVAVPLSLAATEKELEYTVTDSQSSTVVAGDGLSQKVALLCQKYDIRLLSVDDLGASPFVTLPEVAPDRRAMILYTSGTTSKPKGVVATHTCIQAQIESLIEAWHWAADDRIPLFLPLHHIHGIINIMLCALWSGAEIDAFPRFDLHSILHRVSDNAYTVFMAVPTIYVKLIETLEAVSDRQRQSIVSGFADMRLMISGSAALPSSVHQKWAELTGQELLERYGMTEIGMALSNPYHGQRRPGAVGKPLPGVRIRLMSEQGEPVTEEDVVGEIQVCGPNVFREYWNRQEVTDQSFVNGWFRTGDIAVVEDGYYRILGRNSVDIIKSGGYKLSALEIESALLDHPGIVQCAVVGIPEETWGETVAAAVVLRENGRLTLEELHSWCKDRISYYKVPRKLLAVNDLPRNTMGKVTKRLILQLFKTE